MYTQFAHKYTNYLKNENTYRKLKIIIFLYFSLLINKCKRKKFKENEKFCLTSRGSAVRIRQRPPRHKIGGSQQKTETSIKRQESC